MKSKLMELREKLLLFKEAKSESKDIKYEDDSIVKYTATPLFPSKEIMENAMEIRNQIYDDKYNDSYKNHCLKDGTYIELKNKKVKVKDIIYAEAPLIKYTITPLFPNKEIMENALKIRDQIYEKEYKKR